MLMSRLQEQQAAFARERDQLTQHICATKDRAHQKIDLCRQEVKDLKVRREKVLASHASVPPVNS